MLKKLISNILIIQFFCLIPLGNFAQADMGNTMQKKAKKTLLKTVCGKGAGGVAGEIGCKGLDILASNTGFLEEVVNTVLMLSMTLALVNGDCSKTKAGKKLKPKSYTAGITHWIHKIASLIYIYAEVQNIITLRKLDKEFSKKSESEEDGQNNKFQAMYSVQSAKKDAAEKKLKILKISTMGLGAAAAIELGTTTVYTAWSMYLKATEVTECTTAVTDLGSCGVPGATNVAGTTKITAETAEAVNQCTAKFSSTAIVGTLLKAAKSTVMKTVVKGITTVVGGAIGKTITKKLGGGKAARVGGQAVGGVLGYKVGKKITEKIVESVEGLTEDEAGLAQLPKETANCIRDNLEVKAKKWVISNLAGTSVTAACTTPPYVGCPVAIASNCSIKTIAKADGCVCAIRNATSLGTTIEKILSNLKIPSDLVEDEKKLASLAKDAKNDKDVTEEGIKKDTETCGIDYSTWGIRHDLECKAVFDFLNGEDEDKKAENSDSNTEPVPKDTESNLPLPPSESVLIRGFGKEMKSLASFNIEKMLDIHTGLKTNSSEKWAMLFLNDEALIEEYKYLNPEQKEKTNKALGFLSQALVHLQEGIISTAHAQDADQFIDTGRETSVLGGLGITALGMLIFPKFIKKALRMTTVLQRNPLRRGIFYLATYFMADTNVKSTKKKLKTIDHNMKVIEEIMRRDGIPLPSEEEEEVSAIQSILDLLIPSAQAARKNLINSNLVPLCVDGKKFTSDCTCASQGSCGNAITRVKLSGELFKLSPLKKSVKAQLNFMKKMEQGKVTGKNLDQLEQTLRMYAKDLDPVIAANNMDFTLQGSEFPKMDIVLRSKNLVASLQKQGIEEIARLSGKKIDMTKIDFNSNSSSDKEMPKKVSKKEMKKEIEKKITAIIPSAKKRLVSKKKEQNLKDFVLDVGDINQNEAHNLFQMINNRYQKVWKEKKIISN